VEVFKEDEHCEIHIQTTIHECIVMADKDMILRVFNNLIKNAIQSIVNTKEGQIEISVFEEEENYIFKIKDNGIGIADDKHSKIFVPYFTTKSNGTGLGLAMVKQIIENHSGEIWFESVENEGTTFLFKLPKIK
jgi:signal transduction histidine kinase